MFRPSRWLRRTVFGISPRAWHFDRLGFAPADPSIRPHLERVLSTFVEGYHAALDDGRPETLIPRLNAITPEYRGFASEGMSLCMTIFDRLTPWKRNRWSIFQQGLGEPHSYLLHVGYGVAFARLGLPAEQALKQLCDPGERWLAIDGFGFYHGFFHWRRFIEEQAPPPGLTAYPARVFDMGLGRCIWFGCGANIERIGRMIATFPVRRQPDLWCGLGVACTYAGGVSEADLKALAELAHPYQAHLRQGSVFAVKVRHRAGNVVERTELACRALTGLTIAEAVAMVDAAFDSRPPDGTEPGYEVVRRRVQDQLTLAEEVHR